jgi:hypothetical protein
MKFKISKKLIGLAATFLLIFAFTTGVKAVSLEQADVNNDGKVNSLDLVAIIKYFGCPGGGICVPTPPPGQWTDCETSPIGAALQGIPELGGHSGDTIYNLAQDGYTGLVGSLNCQDILDYFDDLPGWTKASICNSHDCLHSRVPGGSAVCSHVAYDYLSYGPERSEGVPPEEQGNLPWATQVAREIADEVGKALMISYGTEQLHLEAHERDFGWENVGLVIEMLAPYGDMWLIQAADEWNSNFNNSGHPSYQKPLLSQMHYEPGPEWRAEAQRWYDFIKAANPNIEVWIQLALHQIGPPEDPPNAELALEYREWLVGLQHGPPVVDGVYISSAYSYPTEAGPDAAHQELTNTFHWACGQETPTPPPATPTPTFPPGTPTPTLPPGQISLVEEGWTDSLDMTGITVLPGYYYRVYENSRYPCGTQGYHQFMVLDHGEPTTDSKHLFAKFLGGAVGFWYDDINGSPAYYPQPNSVGVTSASWNYNMFFRSGVSAEFANGVTKRFRENSDFRMLIPSYCSQDLSFGKGECNQTDDGFCRYGYLAPMEAVDYVQSHFSTNKIITYGGSAGASNFFIGKDQDNVVGIIMDSMAIDLAAIRDACLDGNNVFGASQPCCCPEPDPYTPPWCPNSYRTTCMDVLASRIGFDLDYDEPYHMVERGEVNIPIYLIWNERDASINAPLHYVNLHNVIQQYNPGGNSRVNIDGRWLCITNPESGSGPICNLHVPTAQDYDYYVDSSDNTTAHELVEDVYNWAIGLIY